MPKPELPKPSSRISANEMPYWQIQCLPDRILYTMQPGTSLSMIKGVLEGAQGWHEKIQWYLEVIDKMGGIESGGHLWQTWFAYLGTYEDSQQPDQDTEVTKALKDFQRAACTVGSFQRLPVKAHKAMYWDSEKAVSLPRINYQEHVDMG